MAKVDLLESRIFQKKKHPLGFIQADPTPTEEELRSFYERKYYQNCTSKTYSADYSPEEILFRKNSARVADWIWKKHTGSISGRLADVGCGEGFFAAEFKKLDWSVQCCDFSSFGIERHHPALLPFFQKANIFGHLEKLISEKQKFDFINLSNVLEHVPDPVDLLKRIKRIMVKGSVLRIKVPNDYSRFQNLLLKEKWTEEIWFSPPDHLNYFNDECLNQLFQHEGFKILNLMGDFPIEYFIANTHSNYALHPETGKAAHLARIKIDNHIFERGIQPYIDYYSAAAKLGLGRTLIAFVTI